MPHNASVRANRAAAYIKLRLWPEAVVDCDAVLAMEPGHLKAHMRRAAARMEMGEMEAAAADVDAALAINPGACDSQAGSGIRCLGSETVLGQR